MNDNQELLELLGSALVERVREFRALRDYVMEVACLPPRADIGVSVGAPPFAVEDGETCFAVIFARKDIRPLPYGYKLAEEDIALDDDTVLYSHIAPSIPSGLVRYIPLSASFELPSDDAFELEKLTDDWDAADETGATENDDSAYDFEGLSYDGEQIMSTGEEVAMEEIDDLKDKIMQLVESEETKEAVVGLFETLEEDAAGDLGQLVELLQGVIDELQPALATAHSDLEAKTPLVEATLKGDVNEVRRLLQDDADGNVGAPAFVYSILGDQPEVFEAYVDHGIDVTQTFDWPASSGSTARDTSAILFAAAAGSIWALQRLVALGADPNFEAPGGETALAMAVVNDQPGAIDFLINYSADLSHPTVSKAFVTAANSGRTATIARCLEAGIPIDSTNSSGWTALKMAVSSGHQEVVELLLMHGADANIADEEGWTPLLNAIENGDLELVNLLLSKGANPNMAPDVEYDENQMGFSALMRAAHYGKIEILKGLIAAGADPVQTDSDGASAVHYAALHRHPDCLKVLLEHGADPNSISADGHSAIGMFLIGFGIAMADETVVDENAAIETLRLLIESGASWQHAAQKSVADVGDVQITVLDAANFAIKEQGLDELSEAIARLID